MTDEYTSTLSADSQSINRMAFPPDPRYRPVEGWLILIGIFLGSQILSSVLNVLTVYFGFAGFVTGIIGSLPLSVYVASPLRKMARRLRIQDASRHLEKDPRAPIIYLRPFANEELGVGDESAKRTGRRADPQADNARCRNAHL
jgi:hypothetical protein